MKKSLSILVGLVLLATICVNAQSSRDYLEMSRSLLKLEKKASITQAMTLTDAEALKFWPLYEEYNNKLTLVQNQRINVLSSYAKEYESLTNEQADALLTNSLKYQANVVKLKQQYYKKFKKIVPAGKAARYFQLENKIETIINASLSEELPLIETK